MPAHSDVFQRAAAHLARDGRVVAVWAFGSRAAGIASARSDYDLAVLLDGSPSLDEELKLRADVGTEAACPGLDLVVLNGAPPLLRFEVIATGRRLHARDDALVDEREAAWIREYHDTAHLRAVQRALAREALR